MTTPAPRKKLEPRAAESPLIGDSYTSEDLPPQSKCPDGIRSRVMNSTIGGKFLQNVPVQLLLKHITPEEHRRLSPYKPVHGWRNVPYDTVRETLALLSSSPDWRLYDDWQNRSVNSQCIRCAVVGNGGILKNSRKGKEIDSHHYVFRSNGALLKGFEADVGSRTTHYTFTSTTLRRAYQYYRKLGFRGPPQSEETRYLLLPSDQYDYLLVKAAVTHTVVERGPDKRKNPADIFGPNLSVKKFKMLHPDFMRYIRNRFLHTKHLRRTVDMYRVSTGAATLLTALHTCDQVSAYGFMTPDYGRYSKYYYDRAHQPMSFHQYHDFKMEMNLWQQLHKDGLIRLYMR
ncbi:alpha-N-acetylgalactosaminide alpha-2,6-sialyltransferase 2-like [Cheilinus undulatus]|uniref:alpha-N-acetylgalactosaminide alpha-2,6-sialyltransferase 2-like n=1 Tax=Cheilinus undulatus TaxID=241271 RepID=UPI001BD33956|nr:alpha-N-acetylgalactosaminide alpha-2,6-sialyltransferase 2-like [Cheilinus undulatus]